MVRRGTHFLGVTCKGQSQVCPSPVAAQRPGSMASPVALSPCVHCCSQFRLVPARLYRAWGCRCFLLLLKLIDNPSIFAFFFFKKKKDTKGLETFVLLACFHWSNPGVRRCCKVGHSCMGRVIGCSSVPHKMAWRSVARAIRVVTRRGGPGVRNF